MKSILLIFSSIAILICSSCIKDILGKDVDEVPPEAYKSLDNQSVCMINGSSKWTGTRTRYNSAINFSLDNKQFLRLAYSDGWNSLVLLINPPFIIGKYFFDKDPHISCYDYSSENNYASITLRNENDYETFRTDASNTGWIELKYVDTVNQAFKGTYMFTGKSTSRNFQVKLLNGHFDFRLR